MPGLGATGSFVAATEGLRLPRPRQLSLCYRTLCASTFRCQFKRAPSTARTRVHARSACFARCVYTWRALAESPDAARQSRGPTCPGPASRLCDPASGESFPSSRTEVRRGKKSATLRSWEANCPAVQKENLSPQPWEGQIIFCCREVPEFIHPPTEEHFECFQVLAIKVLLLKDPGVSFYMDISVQLIWINTKDHSFWIVWYYTRSSTLAWKIPWMEEPGGLQSMGSLRVGHN